jgi:hypothetical protein
MEKELTITKKTVSVDKSTKSIDVTRSVNSIIHEQHNHGPKMGTGSCTLCSCPEFIPAAEPGRTCINRNSEGGTCNHYESEHN